MKKFGKFTLAVLVSLFVFTAANAQDLNQVTDLYNGAATALNEGKNVEALEGFQKALTAATVLGEEGAQIATDCKNIIPKIYLQIGKDAASKQNFQEAISNLKNAVAKGTEYAQVETVKDAKELISQISLAEGNNLLNAQDYAGAIEKYKSVIADDPQNGKAYYVLGVAYNQMDNEAEAITALTKAAELGEKEDADTMLAKIYLIKANNALKAKNNAAAIENGLKSAEYKDTPQANKIIGVASFVSKKYDQAITSLEKVAATNEKAYDVKYYLARSYEAKGNKTKACANYKAAAADPRFKQYCDSKVATLCK